MFYYHSQLENCWIISSRWKSQLTDYNKMCNTCLHKQWQLFASVCYQSLPVDQQELNWTNLRPDKSILKSIFSSASAEFALLCLCLSWLEWKHITMEAGTHPDRAGLVVKEILVWLTYQEKWRNQTDKCCSHWPKTAIVAIGIHTQKEVKMHQTLLSQTVNLQFRWQQRTWELIEQWTLSWRVREGSHGVYHPKTLYPDTSWHIPHISMEQARDLFITPPRNLSKDLVHFFRWRKAERLVLQVLNTNEEWLCCSRRGEPMIYSRLWAEVNTIKYRLCLIHWQDDKRAELCIQQSARGKAYK